jgi:hypothetical protein
LLLTLETCGSISEVASFSSSLKLYMFSGYLFTIKFSIFLDALIVSKIHSLVLIFFYNKRVRFSLVPSPFSLSSERRSYVSEERGQESP